MLKRILGILTLALASVITLAMPPAAEARDRDDNRYRDQRGGYGYMTPHQRHEYQERLRRQRQQALEQWRQQRKYQQRRGYGYYDPYSRYGYYDRYGHWRPYR